jgi:hypothetical protein
MKEHTLVIYPNGDVRTLYTDLIDLREIGTLHVERASNVEWDERYGGWTVQFIDGTYLCEDDLGIKKWAGEYEVGVTCRFERREDALAAEVAYLVARL